MLIEVASKDNCRYCTKTKAWLDQHKVKYTHIDLNDDKTRKAFFADRGQGRKTVPLIFFDGELVGGADEFEGYKLVLTNGLFVRSVSFKPFYYEWAVELAKVHEASHWIEEELSATIEEDVMQWKSGVITPDEKAFVSSVFKLFTQLDCEVSYIYNFVLIPKFRNGEIQAMLGSFAAREYIHARSYSLLLTALSIPDDEFHAFTEVKEMTDKIDHMREMDTSTVRGMALCLIKETFNEGVGLFASFVMLLSFSLQSKLKGICQSVEFSIRDENMHCQGLIQLYRALVGEHKYLNAAETLEAEAHAMARETISLEDKFLDIAFGINKVSSIKKDDVKTYIRYITDLRLKQLGFPPLFHIAKNPLPWIEWVVAAPSLTSFFEQTSTDYVVSGMSNDASWADAYAEEAKDAEALMIK